MDQRELLRTEIEQQLRIFKNKRARDKGKAAALKMGAVSMAALVTVLIGLQVADVSLSSSLKNLALALGALATVINAYDAFYDHRSLWVRRTETVARLHELWMDFRFYLAGSNPAEPAPNDTQTLTEFKDRLTRILQDDSRHWLQLRGPAADERRTAVSGRRTTRAARSAPLGDETAR